MPERIKNNHLTTSLYYKYKNTFRIQNAISVNCSLEIGYKNIGKIMLNIVD